MRMTRPNGRYVCCQQGSEASAACRLVTGCAPRANGRASASVNVAAPSYDPVLGAGSPRKRWRCPALTEEGGALNENSELHDVWGLRIPAELAAPWGRFLICGRLCVVKLAGG